MATIEKKNISNPDERRPFAGHGEADVVTIGRGSVGLGKFEPGWKWSQDVRPIAQTDSCQSAHSSFVLSGRMRIRMNSGEEIELEPGDVAIIPPGHDAWVVGDETVTILDWSGMEHYAEAGARKPEEAREPAYH